VLTADQLKARAALAEDFRKRIVAALWEGLDFTRLVLEAGA
jgi:hypothetical protein